jgi:hypothetical protein
VTRALVAAVLLAGAVAAQSNAAIRITAGRAEIRSTPSATAAVFQHVPEGTYLLLIKEEGGWFQVELPPNFKMPGVRAIGYVEARFATRVSGAEAARALETARRPKPKPPGDTIAVAAEVSGTSVWLKAQPTRAVWLAGTFPTLAEAVSTPALLDALRSGSADGNPPPGTHDVTWVWVTAALASPPVVPARRPSFFVSYGEVTGLDSNEWAPAVVRLSAAADWRVVSALPGHGLARTLSARTWEVRRGLMQLDAAGSVIGLAQGIVRVTLNAPLAPGEYALVIRPAFLQRRYAGRDILGDHGPGVAFGAAWVFQIK